MCIPLAVAAVAVSAASAAAQTYTVYRSAQMQHKQARYNQRIARQRATDALQRGAAEETAYRQRISQLVGRQRAAIGAAGVVVDTGAAARLIEDTEAIGELDALTIRNNAAREAWGFESQAGSFGFEAGMARQQQGLGTFATGLGGAAQTVGLAHSLGVGGSSSYGRRTRRRLRTWGGPTGFVPLPAR